MSVVEALRYKQGLSPAFSDRPPLGSRISRAGGLLGWRDRLRGVKVAGRVGARGLDNRPGAGPNPGRNRRPGLLATLDSLGGEPIMWR